jgi:hypothetical protein
VTSELIALAFLAIIAVLGLPNWRAFWFIVVHAIRHDSAGPPVPPKQTPAKYVPGSDGGGA